MALIQKTVTRSIQIVGPYKSIHIQEDKQVLDDSKSPHEIVAEGNFHRRVLEPDTDISGESAEIKTIAAAVWTDQVKADWADYLASF